MSRYREARKNHDAGNYWCWPLLFYENIHAELFFDEADWYNVLRGGLDADVPQAVGLCHGDHQHGGEAALSSAPKAMMMPMTIGAWRRRRGGCAPGQRS